MEGSTNFTVLINLAELLKYAICSGNGQRVNGEREGTRWLVSQVDHLVTIQIGDPKSDGSMRRLLVTAYK